MLKSRRGSMRIIEAVIVCALILIGHTVITRSASIPSASTGSNEELESIGQNLLNVLEDQELLLDLINKTENSALLKELLGAILPPDVLYDISIASLLSGEILADNITNMESTYQSDMNITTSGVYTFSYPLVQKEDILLDIIMVMDRSGSMKDKVGDDDKSKMYYAKLAACNFVDRLNSTTDRAGLVSFATNPSLDEGLTGDFISVKTAINGLYAKGATNMSGGIYYAKTHFIATNRSATWVMILLSDGKANRATPHDADPQESALEQAQIAQSMEVKIYTIGLGAKVDIDETLLKQIQTDGYFYAPSAEELDDVYQAIAEDLIYEVKFDVVMIQITLTKP